LLLLLLLLMILILCRRSAGDAVLSLIVEDNTIAEFDLNEADGCFVGGELESERNRDLIRTSTLGKTGTVRTESNQIKVESSS